jgi:hypothetical protein
MYSTTDYSVVSIGGEIISNINQKNIMILPKSVSPAPVHLNKIPGTVKGKLLKCNSSIYFNKL